VSSLDERSRFPICRSLLHMWRCPYLLMHIFFTCTSTQIPSQLEAASEGCLFGSLGSCLLKPICILVVRRMHADVCDECVCLRSYSDACLL